MLGKLMDYLYGEKFDELGDKLGFWGRITHGWLWTRHPDEIYMHKQQAQQKQGATVMRPMRNYQEFAAAQAAAKAKVVQQPRRTTRRTTANGHSFKSE